MTAYYDQHGHPMRIEYADDDGRPEGAPPARRGEPAQPRTLGDDPRAFAEAFRRRMEAHTAAVPSATDAPELPVDDDEIPPEPAEPARDLKWDVRCSAVEREAWTRAAEYEGVTVSEFVRSAANRAAMLALGAPV